MEFLRRLITLKDRTHQAVLEEKWSNREFIETKATQYIESLSASSLPQSDILVLSEELGTTIQIFEAKDPTKLVIFIPGYMSDGQSEKYDCLILELLRNGVSVGRINNQPNVDEIPEETEEDYCNRRIGLFGNYIAKHLADVNRFLVDHGYIRNELEFHIIASSAGAAAALVTFQTFDKFPSSLVLLSPSGDIHPKDSVYGAALYIVKGGKIHVVCGQMDGFGKQEPFVSLKKLSESVPAVTTSEIENAGHDMGEYYWFGMKHTVQVCLHREVMAGLGLPTQEIDRVLTS